jgi:hypothetical protein
MSAAMIFLDSLKDFSKANDCSKFFEEFVLVFNIVLLQAAFKKIKAPAIINLT